MASTNGAAAAAHDASHSKWIKHLARLGYAAKGVVYAVIGGLALQLALGNGGATTDTKGAVQYLASSPLGKILLWPLALGLLGFVIWRFVQAVMDVDGAGTGKKGMVKRVAHGISGVLYAILLVATLRVLLGGGSSGGGSSAEDWTGKLMSAPFGQALVAVVGLVILGYGVKEAYRGFKKKFVRKLALDGIAARKSKWVCEVSRYGLIARGFVFGVMGVFLLQAAISANPQEASGLGEALSRLASQPFGTILLAVVALGLVAYAAYALVEARYRRLGAAA